MKSNQFPISRPKEKRYALYYVLGKTNQLVYGPAAIPLLSFHLSRCKKMVQYQTGKLKIRTYNGK